MHNDRNAFDAQDPESNRLTREAVIAINRAHLAGVGWDVIAREHGTARKNIQRIVQGRRWRDLHPQISPGLYTAPAKPEPDPAAEIITDALRDARDRILRELRER
jgi:hypothetical protein